MATFNSPPTPHPSADTRDAWLQAMRRYLAIIIPAHLLWEVLQLPLYTIWSDGEAGEIAFAVVHCTGGDALIATATLILALTFAGAGWPLRSQTYRRVAMLTIFLAVGYTAFSEWINVYERKSWAYAETMPVLPYLGTGLSPLLQWIFVPLAAFWWARRPFTVFNQAKEASS